MLPDKSQEEKAKILEECNELLRKIANHAYCTKMLINARNALKLIADYKPPRKR